jgi:hypothetical protein
MDNLISQGRHWVTGLPREGLQGEAAGRISRSAFLSSLDLSWLDDTTPSMRAKARGWRKAGCWGP